VGTERGGHLQNFRDLTDVAVGGAHLLGGWSFLSNTQGFGCDNIVELDVVTADGELLTVNEEQHPDLFWAMRGAGWNFGISTRLVYRMHPIPRKVFGGMLVYDVDDVAETLERLETFWTAAPDEVVYEIRIVPVPFNQVANGRSGPFEMQIRAVYVGHSMRVYKHYGPSMTLRQSNSIISGQLTSRQ